MNNPVKRSTPLKTLAAGALVAALLAGCTPDLPPLTVDQDQVDAPGPVLTEQQGVEIAAAVGEELEGADKDMDAAALPPRVTGPALAIRKAEYTIAKAQKEPEAITELPAELQSLFLSQAPDWPRTVFAVTQRPENLESERFIVLTQESARANYALWAWFTLFPGIEVPTFPSAETGTTDFTVLDEALGLSPKDALTQYADVLANPTDSKFKDVFGKEADPFMTELTDRRKSREEAAKQVKGSYKETFTAGDDFRTLKTIDGGAVVVGTITTTETLLGEKGSIIAPDDIEKTFLPADFKATNGLIVKRTAIVGIYLPAKDSEETPRAIGRIIRTTGAEIPPKK